MKYNKPEVNVLGAAAETIQSGPVTKLSGPSDPSSNFSIPTAYDLDE